MLVANIAVLSFVALWSPQPYPWLPSLLLASCWHWRIISAFSTIKSEQMTTLRQVALVRRYYQKGLWQGIAFLFASSDDCSKLFSVPLPWSVSSSSSKESYWSHPEGKTFRNRVEDPTSTSSWWSLHWSLDLPIASVYHLLYLWWGQLKPWCFLPVASLHWIRFRCSPQQKHYMKGSFPQNGPIVNP